MPIPLESPHENPQQLARSRATAFQDVLCKVVDSSATVHWDWSSRSEQQEFYSYQVQLSSQAATHVEFTAEDVAYLGSDELLWVSKFLHKLSKLIRPLKTIK
ncbi:MAG: hypothetical protein ABSD59_01835 [Terracidiphilus sp.]|jgi:hypothetical protein